jgi:membrane protease YdiL (CAAX protease family)
MGKFPAIEGVPMDSEIQPQITETQQSGEQNPAIAPEPLALMTDAEEYRGLKWIFIGSEGLRAGWSVLIFLILSVIFIGTLGFTASWISKNVVHHTKTGDFTAIGALIGEVISVLGIFGAAKIVSLIERRRVLDYNLTGPSRLLHFVSGLVVGFAALSTLIGFLAWGGWLHFGSVALSGAQVFTYAALWALAFLGTGFFEEGVFRCYLQFTLTRGLNFWIALVIHTAVCGLLLTIRLVTGKDGGYWGVYVISLLGLLPCFLLHLKKSPGSGFWQAAWVTSMLFGAIHTGNNGENWIGIFQAAAIGFVFCVSVRLTGSAWWAIGAHAAWDWAETYFYGAIDSGNVATGHLLTVTPAGSTFWSGGADGPEGSLLGLPVILLILLTLIVFYGRKKPVPVPAPQLEQAA